MDEKSKNDNLESVAARLALLLLLFILFKVWSSSIRSLFMEVDDLSLERNRCEDIVIIIVDIMLFSFLRLCGW